MVAVAERTAEVRVFVPPKFILFDPPGISRIIPGESKRISGKSCLQSGRNRRSRKIQHFPFYGKRRRYFVGHAIGKAESQLIAIAKGVTGPDSQGYGLGSILDCKCRAVHAGKIGAITENIKSGLCVAYIYSKQGAVDVVNIGLNGHNRIVGLGIGQLDIHG